MRKVLLVLFGVVFIVLFTLLPETPSTAYPPQTPLPPIPVTAEPTVYVPEADSPQWLYVECGGLLYVQIGWYDPPGYLLPFNPVASGYLYVDYGNTTDLYPLVYNGYSYDNWHYWHVYTPMPPQDFRLSAFVRDVDNNGHWVDPFFLYVDCYDELKTYLPYVVK